VANRLTKLSQRIRLELNDIERAVTRAQAAWREYQASGNDLYLDSVALNLHSFYNGIERLFEGIATTLDNRLPDGHNWHKRLLMQMAQEVAGIRPAVISDVTRDTLDNYCRFRHVVRNIYGYRLDPAQLQPLAEAVNHAYEQAQQELIDFANWVEQF